MKETIHWDASGKAVRTAAVALCGWCTARGSGWCTRQGRVTRTGQRIAATDWDKLSPTARNVLTRHGIAQ